MKTIKLVILAAAVFTLVSCGTDPGEKTTLGAATGGVLGAGLGAVVGNQTGNAGSGMVVGAAAGAGTGAALGNVFDAQDEAIRTQDEAIERQDRMIANQESEIEELRRLSQDQVSFRGAPRQPGAPSSYANAVPADRMAADRMAVRGARGADTRSAAVSQGVAGNVSEKTVVESSSKYQPLSRGTFGKPVEPEFAGGLVNPSDSRRIQSSAAERGALEWSEGTASNSAVTAAGAGSKVYTSAGASGRSPECQKAEKEVQNAVGEKEVADKLFHYRRALRLCPTNPVYHNGLGEIYLSLQRMDDAEYEFREALKLDSHFRPAIDNLQSVKP